MQVRVTAKIKIEPKQEIIKTIELYKQGLQYCVDTAWAMKIRNNVQLHPFVYPKLRETLPSQLSIACIKQACGMVKKAKSNPIINKVSIRYNFPRSASFKNNILSISTIKGRVRIPFQIPECYEKYFSWNVSESLLTINKEGICYFLFTFSRESPINSDLHNQVLGVDLGVNNLAVTSNKQFFKSSKVKQAKRKFNFLRSKLQRKGTRSSRRLLKKISGRENRFMRWVNHNISKEIVSSFTGNKIVMENLKGIRRTHLGRRMNYWISNWSFYQLQNFIQYKAEFKGIEVIRVKPNYTSQICSRCGELGSRKGSSFVCFHCGYSLNSDLNASQNLASPMLEKRQVAVIQPHNQASDSEGSLRPIEDETMVKSPTL